MFYPSSAWHAQGLRWIAGLIIDLASFVERTESASGERAALGPGEACDEARSRMRYRVPYY